MALTDDFACYETPSETMAKIKHAIKLATTRVCNPMSQLAQDDLFATTDIANVMDGQCRWPKGDNGEMCGRACGEKVYCEVHHARAVQKPFAARSND